MRIRESLENTYGIMKKIKLKSVSMEERREKMNRRQRTKMSTERREGVAGMLFILPSLVGICIFVLVPFIDVVRRSFMSATTGIYRGMENYTNVIQNQAFRLASWNTIKFTVICLPLLIGFSLVLAVLVYSLGERGGHFRKSFLISLAIPVASITLLWNVLLHDKGIINSFLVEFEWNRDWMNTKWSFWILIISYIWKNIGYDMLLWLAGLAAIPESIYEAAAVDGAGKIKTFFFITIPNLMPTLYTIGVISFLNSFKVFREAYLVAGSYPHEDIYLLQHLFNNWFIKLDMDKLTAGAVIMAIAILGLIIVMKKIGTDE